MPIPAASTEPSAPSSSAAQRALPQGMRSTRAVRAVLALMESDPSAARSGTEVVAALERRGVPANRVTVYRLLDRLAVAGLLDRHVDAQRVTRYTLAGSSQERWGARFECAGCHRQFRIADGAASLRAAMRRVLQALAEAGHAELAADVSVRGRCAECVRTGAGETRG
ncbi:Fur family transcriptional regulator [Paracidovorax avenae]|uniref:transcriptional repressor n=1 Tax=Paracidovorax avenae TaxID=80867 RepID=UPI000D165C4A|nr:transcriptional repressor [Paracidovorax avenae]AVS81349.1 Fur family transcriptional regulator [Paracidovorax avenae]AVS88613.1 Fur family transcriptional regulator [Paracidovorax avenae]AVS90873.1 Fur family transcriptional regulator [Paracidovorax avenae]AVS99124.1 Fur family transcriptional regulator [Paracidovorax avenae]AVT06125.1 Fur family transcriptional regulator [Paracidovorax avenae]